MTSFYYPFKGGNAIVVQSIPFAQLAVSASAPQSSTIPATSASYAVSVQNTPSPGTNGITRVLADCPLPAPSGATGPTGPSGSKGADATTCPFGTKECPSLHVSLSGDWVGPTGLRGVNFYRPSGSQFSIVCISTVGFIASSITCPAYLPTSSNVASIPAIP